jgi:hypothetical protein
MPRPFLGLLAAAALAAAVAPARATVLVPADLAELSRSASAIVHGTVTLVRSEWAEGRRRVETVVTISVDQALKGALTGHVSFKVPGGDMGRYRSVMIGAPSFREGEAVIVFLGGQGPALPYLLGLGQGVYRVQQDGRTGEARVMTPAWFADADGAVPVRRGSASARGLSVEEFAAQVREAVASGDQARRPHRAPVAPRRGRG